MTEKEYNEKYQKTGAVRTSWWRDNILSGKLLASGDKPELVALEKKIK